MSRLSVLVVLYSVAIIGCNGHTDSNYGWTMSESGADVDDPSINGRDSFLIGGYENSASVIATHVSVDPGKTPEEFAADVETAWNSYPGIHQIGRCEHHPSILMFPRDVDDIVFLDETGGIMRLGNGTITLGNGMQVRRHHGPCPPPGPEP